MKITWLGHACFALESGDFRLVLDPFEEVPGLPDTHTRANRVLCSHLHDDHHYLAGVELVGGGTDPFTVETVETFHDDCRGALRGGNTVHVLRAEGLTVVHLGDLGHDLTEAQAAPLCRCDVLMLPVGGTYTIDGPQAARLTEQLQPRIVLPMHYRSERFGFDEIAPLQPFLAALRGWEVRTYSGNALTVTADTPRQAAILDPLA